MAIASPAACCVPGAYQSTTVWTAVRVTVGVHWFARGREANGCWQESSPGVMAVVTPPSLGCTRGLAGSCDGLIKSSTNPTRTDDGEEHFGLPMSLMSLSCFRAGSSRCMSNGLCVTKWHFSLLFLYPHHFKKHVNGIMLYIIPMVWTIVRLLYTRNTCVVPYCDADFTWVKGWYWWWVVHLMLP